MVTLGFASARDSGPRAAPCSAAAPAGPSGHMMEASSSAAWIAFSGLTSLPFSPGAAALSSMALTFFSKCTWSPEKNLCMSSSETPSRCRNLRTSSGFLIDSSSSCCFWRPSSSLRAASLPACICSRSLEIWPPISPGSPGSGPPWVSCFATSGICRDISLRNSCCTCGGPFLIASMQSSFARFSAALSPVWRLMAIILYASCISGGIRRSSSSIGGTSPASAGSASLGRTQASTLSSFSPSTWLKRV
mmetsp:Transcript_89863/g.254652  ORF Transcript_89863/g.254652 Transcript_89863/m.254652 type:complete len:248 (+) Transcript_89863:469-1212(+)